MKILYCHYLGKISGVSIGPFVHIQEFAAAMKRRGHQVEIFPALDVSGAASGGSSGVRPVSKYIKQFKSLFQNIGAFFRESEKIRRFRPDVIVCRYSLFRISIILAARLRRVPLVFEVNSPMAYEVQRLKKEFFYLPVIPAFFEKACLKWAEVLVVVSGELKQYLVRLGIPGRRIHVVPNGVDPERMNASRRTGPLPALGPAQRGVTIGFVGSFNYWHSIDSIYNPMKQVLARFRHAQFVLIGDGFTRPDIEKRVCEDGLQKRIRMPGFIAPAEIPAWLSRMDILLAPYPRLEFFYFSPLKIFEYMAAAKPVLAMRIGQIAEIIEDGVTGFLYSDEAEFIRKITLLIQSRGTRIRMGKAARHRIEEKYTWDRSAARIEALCRSIEKGKRG